MASRRLQFLCGLASLLYGRHAHAASFDCSKASSTIEHAICNDRRLSELDTELAKQFADVLHRSRAGSAALVTEQREWLAFRDGCTFGSGPSREQLAGCLIAAYRARITQLKARGCMPQSSVVVPSVAAGSIDRSQWDVCAALLVNLRRGEPDATVVLLKSKAPLGKDGFGQPFYGVDLLIVGGTKVLYRYTDSGVVTQHFVDDALEIRDLSGHGDRSVVFHAGIVNAGDFVVAEHVIYAMPDRFAAKDVAPPTFWDSPRQYHHWISFGNQSLVLLAEPIEPLAVDDPRMCSTCSKYYQYVAYRWDAQQLSFIPIKSFPSRRALTFGIDPLEEDRPLIEHELAQVAPK